MVGVGNYENISDISCTRRFRESDRGDNCVMRIALIYLGRKGGGTVYSLEIAKALNIKEDVLAVISSQVENLNLWGSSGIKILKVSTFNNKWQVIPSTLNIIKFINLTKQIKKFNPDIIYYPMGHIWIPILNLFLKKIPKVMTLHDPILHTGEDNFFWKLLQKIEIKQSDRFIILSNIFTNYLKKKGISIEKIDVIPHGEFSYYSKYKISKAANKKPTILFFGRISQYKGLDILLKAFPIIKKEISECRLIIAGNGDIKPYKQLMIGLKDIIVFNQWIKDEETASYFGQADLIVLPYKDATQSGIIPIAYSMKLPVVTTNVGGLPEQVQDGRDGLLVNPCDEKDLAIACIRLLSNPILAKKMGEEGYKKAMIDWSWENIGNKIIKSFEKTVYAKKLKKQS